MRKYNFKEGKALKGGLHCHTTRSDGHGTPEEVIRLHKANGYDFLAITDHRYYNFKNFAPKENLTIIPGMEFDNNRLPTKSGFRCFHTVCIGPLKENGNGFNQDERLDSAKAANQEEYQPFLDDIHNKDNLTLYCHPQWSSTPARYFEKQRGNFAMEIWNTGCAMESDMDYDASYWDELLGQGIKIYGVATDDGHAMNEHCKGWVMVNAKNNVDSILKALKEGDFYSSCGPQIYAFYIKDKRAIIDCSEVTKIRLHSDAHPTNIIRDDKGNLTHHEFSLESWTGTYDYARISIMDEDGNMAWTNPIFIDED